MYLRESSIKSGVGRAFIIFEDGEEKQYSSLAYFPDCLIFDDFFARYKRIYSVEEMEQYSIEHGSDKNTWIQ